ncbi:MAG: hypothetical protein QOD51_2528 [Candidatus Eremiobacteraeota bacterium]|jgi:hypothetical protein|nr:hypothetical protein [Candidatus Eremiobacteraeota bacterium]
MQDHEIRSDLDLHDLDVDELERRLEMSVGAASVTPDWSVGVTVSPD